MNSIVKIYDGTSCIVSLSNATDAYEVSFVAVPAQPGAGVTKTYGGEDNRSQNTDEEKKELENRVRLCEAKMKLLNAEKEQSKGL